MPCPLLKLTESFPFLLMSCNTPTKTQAGGALYADGSVMRINDSKLVGNEATLVSGTGGAIFSFNSKIDLGSTVFLDNKAGDTGTAVRLC